MYPQASRGLLEPVDAGQGREECPARGSLLDNTEANMVPEFAQEMVGCGSTNKDIEEFHASLPVLSTRQ